MGVHEWQKEQCEEVEPENEAELVSNYTKVFTCSLRAAKERNEAAFREAVAPIDLDDPETGVPALIKLLIEPMFDCAEKALGISH